jgi:hypothetical protein
MSALLAILLKKSARLNLLRQPDEIESESVHPRIKIPSTQYRAGGNFATLWQADFFNRILAKADACGQWRTLSL